MELSQSKLDSGSNTDDEWEPRDSLLSHVGEAGLSYGGIPSTDPIGQEVYRQVGEQNTH